MTTKPQAVLLKNTVFLYVLVFSNYLFSFITVPYQTRVLGVENYGKLGFALAAMSYFQFIIDFGFLLSATGKISQNRDKPKEVSRILTGVTVSKFMLLLLSLVILTLICLFVSAFRENWQLYYVCFFSIAATSFLPDFLFRGLEKMEVITISSVAIRAVCTLLIFVFLRSREDYYIVPLLNAVSAVGAVGFIYVFMYRKTEVRFVRVSFSFCLQLLKESSTFFYSRIATTLHTATNTFLLGLLSASNFSVVGIYTSADKLISTSKSCFSPIADSMYPYMLKHKNFRLIKRTLIIAMPLITLGCIVVGIFADPLCVLIFGAEFAGAGRLLQLLLPITVMTLPSYLLGFPTMAPIGLSKHANYSVIFSSLLHIVIILFLFLVRAFTVENLCIATTITAFVELAYRCIIVIKNRKLFERD